MQLLWLTLVFPGCVLAKSAVVRTQVSRPIVGGEAVEITEIPYQVSVQSHGAHICGGSILSEKVVLTAGHCIFGKAASYSIQYGISKMGSKINIISAERILRHQLYNASNTDYDAGLIFLKEHIQFGVSAKAIGLPSAEPFANMSCIASGWGITEEGGTQLARTLQKVYVEVIDRKKCALQYQPYPVTERMLCAGIEQGGRDSCQGDSGGPLVTKNNQIIGIVSWGIGCAKPQYPGVYTNVFTLRDWIEKHLNEIRQTYLHNTYIY